MEGLTDLALSQFDYDLPEALIAQVPLADRSASRLMVVHRDSGQIEHRKFTDCPDYFRPDDVLVLNETKVTAVRLIGSRVPKNLATSAIGSPESTAKVELLLVRPSAEPFQYWALTKPAKRLTIGTKIKFDLVADPGTLEAVVTGIGEAGLREIQFTGGEISEKLGAISNAPLPPYIHEKLKDVDRYQTVYHDRSQSVGSVAAPTAGLHFTEEMLARIAATGVKIAKVNLTVGLDTFRPIQTENISDHAMHGEFCVMPEAVAETINRCLGRVIAVGTTSARTIETFAREPKAAGARVGFGSVTTSIFLHPRNKFQVVDAMFTNFHMPRTTMLLMISALAGRDLIFRAYQKAVEEKYRFLSFGDSMLIL